MTESEKKIVGAIFQKYEASSYRLMEYENFLVDIMSMNPIKRMFVGKKIRKFLKEQSEKYYEVLKNE